MRARQPDVQGVVGGREGGIASAYDVYNQDGSPTVVLLPTWTITHAMHWKAQIPVLARHYRVITMDGRGNGRSDRPADPGAYTHRAYADDVLAVLDEVGAGQAIIAGVSDGGALAAYLAANHPDRVLGAVMITPGLGFLTPAHPYRRAHAFDEVLADDEGWALWNEHAWRRDFPKFADFFWRQVFTEPHSTKQTEDATADDALMPPARSEAIADITGADLLLVSGGGHCPPARDPILVNRALRDFIDRVTPPAQRAPRRSTWTRALSRPRRVLYLRSSSRTSPCSRTSSTPATTTW
jgi:pimeloyl-ACP methyl ester carboxylesterase